jgi:hypothetical protein
MIPNNSGRYERKYLLTEETALKVRRFVAAYVPHDQHMNGHDSEGYVVHTLYLDSPQLELYRRSVSNEKNRYKLRIRFYDLTETSPAFVEIKRRMGDTIHKQRAIVSKQAARSLVAGEVIGASELLVSNDSAARALMEFSELRDRIGASANVFVHYQREAFAATSADGTRVTFDRRVAAEPFNISHSITPNGNRQYLTPACVVLELKHFGHAPLWLSDLAATFELRRSSFPKYIRCFDRLHPAHPLGAPAFSGALFEGAYTRELA